MVLLIWNHDRLADGEGAGDVRHITAGNRRRQHQAKVARRRGGRCRSGAGSSGRRSRRNDVDQGDDGLAGDIGVGDGRAGHSALPEALSCCRAKNARKPVLDREMIDDQDKRLAAFSNRLPMIIVVALYGVSIVGIGLPGMAAGLNRSVRGCRSTSRAYSWPPWCS
jgi:hypothetical protein